MDKNKVIIRNNMVAVVFAITAAILFYCNYSIIPSILLMLNGIILLHSAYLLYINYNEHN